MARTLKLLCPFHDDHRPSLNVDAASGRAYCFVCRRSAQLNPQTMLPVPQRRRPIAPINPNTFVRCDEDLMVELWLSRRGLDTQTAQSLGMRAARQGNQHFIAFAYLSGDGRVLYWKLRRVDQDNKYVLRTPTGVRSALYNLPALDCLHDWEAPIVVEGEPDVAAVHQAGEKGVVSVPDGCGSHLSEALLAPLARFSTIKIGVDHDDAGNALAARLQSALAPRTCERIAWNGVAP